jgi:hypothetical protein
MVVTLTKPKMKWIGQAHHMFSRFLNLQFFFAFFFPTNPIFTNLKCCKVSFLVEIKYYYNDFFVYFDYNQNFYLQEKHNKTGFAVSIFYVMSTLFALCSPLKNKTWKDQIILTDFWVPHEIDSWNCQHMLDLWFSDASQNFYFHCFIGGTKGKNSKSLPRLSIVFF